MGTHCYVGMENEVGEVVYAYVHYDGYPDGVGKVLLQMEPEDVQDAIEGGQMRCLSATAPHTPEYLDHNEGCEVADGIEEYTEEVRGNVPYAYLLAYGDADWQVFHTYGDRAGAWADLREVLGDKAPARVQPASEPGYNQTITEAPPMRTNEIIGYRVVNVNHDFFVDTDANGSNFTTDQEPKPIPRGDALRRMAAFMDANPGEDLGDYEVQAVYRETTPIENAAHELGGLFESLCRRHGLDFGLSREQIDQQLVKDLEAVKNGLGFGGVAGITAGFGVGQGNARR